MMAWAAGSVAVAVKLRSSLSRLEGRLLQPRQRRVAGAEVVERDVEAVRAEVMQLLAERRRGRSSKSRSLDLQADVAGSTPCAAARPVTSSASVGP